MSIDLLETSAASSGVLPISSNVAASAVLPAQPWTFRPGHHALQRALLNSVPMVAADAAVVSLSLAAGLSVVHVLGVAGGGDLTALLLPLCGAGHVVLAAGPLSRHRIESGRRAAADKLWQHRGVWRVSRRHANQSCILCPGAMGATDRVALDAGFHSLGPRGDAASVLAAPGGVIA